MWDQHNAGIDTKTFYPKIQKRKKYKMQIIWNYRFYEFVLSKEYGMEYFNCVLKTERSGVNFLELESWGFSKLPNFEKFIGVQKLGVDMGRY